MKWKGSLLLVNERQRWFHGGLHRLMRANCMYFPPNSVFIDMSALVRVFTPRKLANIINLDSLIPPLQLAREPVVKHWPALRIMDTERQLAVSTTVSPCFLGVSTAFTSHSWEAFSPSAFQEVLLGSDPSVQLTCSCSRFPALGPYAHTWLLSYAQRW